MTNEHELGVVGENVRHHFWRVAVQVQESCLGDFAVDLRLRVLIGGVCNARDHHPGSFPAGTGDLWDVAKCQFVSIVHDDFVRWGFEYVQAALVFVVVFARAFNLSDSFTMSIRLLMLGGREIKVVGQLSVSLQNQNVKQRGGKYQIIIMVNKS